VLGGGDSSAFSDLDGLTAGQAASTRLQHRADPNTQRDCRVLADVNSVQKYWSDLVPRAR
jgi:hypothetical protein